MTGFGASSTRDGYVGYIAKAAVSKELTNPTHRVSVPATFLYPLAGYKIATSRQSANECQA